MVAVSQHGRITEASVGEFIIDIKYEADSFGPKQAGIRVPLPISVLYGPTGLFYFTEAIGVYDGYNARVRPII